MIKLDFSKPRTKEKHMESRKPVITVAIFSAFFWACGTESPARKTSEIPTQNAPALHTEKPNVGQNVRSDTDQQSRTADLGDRIEEAHQFSIADLPKVPLTAEDERLLGIIGGSLSLSRADLSIVIYLKYIQHTSNFERDYRIAAQIAHDAWDVFARDPQGRWKAVNALYHSDRMIRRGGIYALFSTKLESDRKILHEYVKDQNAPAEGRQFAFDYVFKDSEWSDEEIEQFRRDPSLAERADKIWLERLEDDELALNEALSRYARIKANGKDDSWLRGFIRSKGGHLESGNPLIPSVDKDNFEDLVIERPGLVVVDVWGVGCQPCAKIKPILEELARKYSDPNVAFLSFKSDDYEKDSYFVAKILHTSDYNIPTFLFFINGKLVYHFTDYDPSQLRAKVRKYARQVEQMQ